MSPNEYQQAALRTCDMLGDRHHDSPIVNRLTDFFVTMVDRSEVRRSVCWNRDRFEMLNGVMGLNGEAGECEDIVKKWLFQGHDLDEKHLAEELGDVAWYLAVCAHGIGYNLEDIFQMNIDKLKKRYPNGFDAEHSIHRKENDNG